MSLPEEELDPKFEFDAPKNYDFITHSSQVGDDWFGIISHFFFNFSKSHFFFNFFRKI